MKRILHLVFVTFSFYSFSQNFEEVIIADANNWIQPKHIDLDGDGLLDLVSVSRGGTVAWWQQDSNNEFAKLVIDTTSKSWNNLDVYDMDGDGDLDILVSENGSIEIYYNDGNQNFIPTFINSNSLSSNIIAGDFDGDGYVDFITTGRGIGSPVKLWKNVLNIGFQQTTITNVIIYTGDILANDIDNDGDLDIIMSVFSLAWDGNHVLCFLNDGNGNFTEHIINYSLSTEQIQILDYDNDGDKDFAVKRGADRVVLFTNNGNLNFTDTELTNDTDLSTMYITDYDNDGDKDIAVTFTYFSEDDDSFFGFYQNDGNNNFTLYHLSDLEKGEAISGFDYDTDGFTDYILTSEAEDDPRIYNNLGAGNFNTTILDDSFPLPSSFIVSDINNDGQKDIVTTSGDEKELVLWVNNGLFNFTKTVIDNLDSLTPDAYIADINGDGNQDILATNYKFNAGEVLLYSNDGSQNFTKSTLIDVTSIRKAIPVDIDNDGDLDIIISRPGGGNTGQLWFYINDGVGNFQSNFIRNIGDQKICIGFKDVNNDGHEDLITNGSFYFQNDGNLNFTEITLPAKAEFYDIDTDGDLDFLASYFDFTNSLNFISWYENDGSGNFLENIITNTGSTNSGDKFTIQDFDGDGDIDFVSCPTNQFNSQKLSFWVNDGNQIFTREEINLNYLTSTHLISDDLDGDGDIDVISSNLKFPFTIWNNTSNIPLSIHNIQSSLFDVIVFPNPTKNIISIQGNTNITNASLYNNQGQKIDIKIKNNQINLINQASGVYFLQLKTDNGLITKKIIKH